MIHYGQTTYNCADYLTGSSLSLRENAMMEGQCRAGDGIEAIIRLSEVRMNATKNDTESTVADTHAGVPMHVTPVRTEPVTDLFVAKSYDDMVEIAGLPCYSQYCSAGNEILDTPMLSHLMPEEEIFSTGKYMNIESQVAEKSLAYQMQATTISNTCGFQSNLKGKEAASGLNPTPLRNISRKSRKRSNSADCQRRFIVTERLQALQELLPASLKINRQSLQSNRESILDNAIGHIIYLQLQLKELSGSRLGGESVCAPLIFVEGHGHYNPHDQMFKEPLEEVVGSLIEENPTAAHELLESKGLYMMPMASIDELCAVE